MHCLQSAYCLPFYSETNIEQDHPNDDKLIEWQQGQFEFAKFKLLPKETKGLKELNTRNQTGGDKSDDEPN